MRGRGAVEAATVRAAVAMVTAEAEAMAVGATAMAAVGRAPCLMHR